MHAQGRLIALKCKCFMHCKWRMALGHWHESRRTLIAVCCFTMQLVGVIGTVNRQTSEWQQ